MSDDNPSLFDGPQSAAYLRHLENAQFWYILNPSHTRMVVQVPHFGWYEWGEHDIHHPGAVVFTSRREAERVGGLMGDHVILPYPKAFGFQKRR